MEKLSDKINIPLLGLNSEHCALIIGNGIAKLNGIVSSKVDYNNQRAVVEIDSKKISIPEIIKTIRGLGYNVAITKKSIQITGMSCASCAISTETILNAQKGIVTAVVNFANSTALV